MAVSPVSSVQAHPSVGDDPALALAADAFVASLPTARRETARQRFSRVGPRLLPLLRSLYGQMPDFDVWFAGLCTRLGDLAASRSSALQAIDAEREHAPDWFIERRLLGYSAYVDRFAGTLAGVIRRIPHLHALGVDYLHLLPFLRARPGDNDGGFAVEDYASIEPALGTMEELEQLCSALRAERISLCADFVLNHVADTHLWAREARAGNPLRRAFFHVFPDHRLPDAHARTAREVFPQIAPGNFTYNDELGGWVWTTFYPFQWDLNYANPQVFAEISCSLLALANRGIEIFRLDSAPFLWKRLGTDCVNQPEVHRILKALRCCVELAAPAVLLKAEAIVPTPELAPYLGGGDETGAECSLAYHGGMMAAGWAALAEGDTTLLRSVLDTTPVPPAHTGWISYVRCHDEIIWGLLQTEIEEQGADFAARIGHVVGMLEGTRAGAFGHGAAFQTAASGAIHGSNGMTSALVGLNRRAGHLQRHGALSRFRLLYALAFCVGTVPLVYMGDELALGNNEAPEDAARRAADGRWLQRPRFDDTLLALAAEPTSPAGQSLRALQQLAACRKRLPDLDARLPLRILPLRQREVLALRRGRRFMAVLNFAGQQAQLRWDELIEPGDHAAHWRRALPELPPSSPADAVLHAEGVTLGPWGMCWLTCDH